MLSIINITNMAELSFSETRVPQQKYCSNNSYFPLILTPSNNNKDNDDISSFKDAIKSHKQLLISRLISSSAILFRGFPVTSANDFNDVVEAFGFDEFPYVGGAAPRSNVVGRVFTANECPPDQKIPFHHEMAQVPEFPSKILLFCEVEPKNGGETPIVLSHMIYQRMKERHPEFVQQLEEHGLIYTRFLGDGDNLASPIGRGWKSTYFTDDKNIAELRAAKLGTKLEWTENGVKTIMGPISGVKFDKSRQHKVWFNSMVVPYTGWKDELTVTLGDGTPLPEDVVHDCLKILEEESVAIPWKKGDVLLIDNWAVLHSRRSFEPPRRVLASICK